MILPHLHSTSPFLKMAFKGYNIGQDFHDFPFFYIIDFPRLLHYTSLKLWQRTFVLGRFYRGGSTTTHVVLHGSGVTQPRSGWESWIKGDLQLNILLMILLNLWVCDTEDGAEILWNPFLFFSFSFFWSGVYRRLIPHLFLSSLPPYPSLSLRGKWKVWMV